MRSSFPHVFLATFLLSQATATQLSRIEERDAVSVPICSLECVATLVPEVCGSLTNSTCICTDTTLDAKLGQCALAACNITEIFQLQKYKADTCGVVNDRSILQRQLNGYYVLPALATFFLVVRLYCRAVKETLGQDDWMMVAAYVFYLIGVASGMGMMVNKFGLHTYQLTTRQMENSLMYFYMCELWYIVAITLMKLSLLFFLRRIFSDQKNFDIATWTLVAYTAVSNFAVLIGLTFQCTPFHGIWTNWEYKVPPVKCIDVYALVYFAAANNIFQDLAILVLPIKTTLALRLTWKQKANVLVMFSVGGFVVLCSVLRLPSLITLKKSTDPSWDQGPIALWTHLEQCVGIICGCLPACRSLLNHLFPRLQTIAHRSSTNKASDPSGSRASRMKSSLGMDKWVSGPVGSDQRDASVELIDRADPKDHGMAEGGTNEGSRERNGIGEDHDYVPSSIHSDESKIPFGAKGGGTYGSSVDINGGKTEEKLDGSGV